MESQEKVDLELQPFNIPELQDYSRKKMVKEILKEIIPEILLRVQDNPTKKYLEIPIQYTIDHNPKSYVLYMDYPALPYLTGDILNQLKIHFPGVDISVEYFYRKTSGLCWSIPEHIVLKMSW